ncbi:hypothetical protein N0V85_001270 [Neurospora sp. IMI 360204]|nr:hypothetical protein N0V85_001270 [Neurospora sp. IMI 360204]
MSYHAPTGAIDLIEPEEREGFFDSIIKSLKSLTDPNNVGWDTLAGTVAECKAKWNLWYAGFVARENFLRREEQWKGNGQSSSLYLLQTVTELCNALEALNRWVGAIAKASASLESLNLDDEVVINFTRQRIVESNAGFLPGCSPEKH